jgi:histone H2B
MVLRRGRRRNQAMQAQFATYTYKVLKQVHPDTGISRRAMQTVDDIICELFENIAREARVLVDASKKKTVTSREVGFVARDFCALHSRTTLFRAR